MWGKEEDAEEVKETMSAGVNVTVIVPVKRVPKRGASMRTPPPQSGLLIRYSEKGSRFLSPPMAGLWWLASLLAASSLGSSVEVGRPAAVEVTTH